jgi:hypothetical protein
MLFKDIIQFYGKSLSGDFIKPEEDVVFCAADMDELGVFRQRIIDDISGAKAYLLDGRSASYLDSLRQMMGHDLDAYKRIAKLMSEVTLPAEIVWVECDYKQLEIDRANRGLFPDHERAMRLADAEIMGLRGFLIDNRSPKYLKITPFRTDANRTIIDPLTHMMCDKDSAGKVDFDRFKTTTHPHMTGFFSHPSFGVDQATLETMMRDEFENAAYDLALPYLLFAELSSEDQVIMREEHETLSSREQKTAKKFGKTWMIDALRSHVTVRIGDAGEAHLNEIHGKLQNDAERPSSRAEPIEHKVRGHFRKYESGKVTWVKSHRRGKQVSSDVPTRVVGPSNKDVDV